MIDYNTIGLKIRNRRKELKISQEKLAEMCDVGTTHISHIETGNCIPSLKVFISILNALNITADSLLCNELNTTHKTYINDISETLEDCDIEDLRIITETIKTLKIQLNKRPKKEI